MSSDILGIDLGTTFSCVAIYLNDTPKVVPNSSSGSETTPSWVLFGTETPVVGEVARSKAGTSRFCNSIVNDAKRLIGRKYDDKELQEYLQQSKTNLKVVNHNGNAAIEIVVNNVPKTIMPEEVSAEVLKSLKASAEKFAGRSFSRAVVTIPAFFSNGQRAATIKAVEASGLELENLIHEPTAAALAYGLGQEQRDKNILVFDFGGGTLDVTILRLHENVLEVKATCGDTLLGGRDIDRNLFKYLALQIDREYNIDVIKDRANSFKLERACEEIKCGLSSPHQILATAYCEMEDEDIELDLTRAAFEDLNKQLFERCLKPVDGALARAQLKKSDIQEVVMVGGSSRIPKLRDMLRAHIGIEPKSGIHPDHAIAMGAAIFAASKSCEGENEESKKMSLLSIHDITPMSLGICLNGMKMGVLIEKDTEIPCTAVKEFQTSQNMQTTATIAIYEGESENVEDNMFLGRCVITGLPPRRAGRVKVKVTFSRDVNGILKVKAQASQYPSINATIELNPSEKLSHFQFNTHENTKSQYFGDYAGLSKIKDAIEYDQFLNPLGNKYDLGRDGAFSDMSIIIGKFYSGEGFTNEQFSLHAGKDLTRKGFKWKIFNTEQEFTDDIHNHDIAWILSSMTVENPQAFSDAVMKFHRDGKGLFIWADNTPYTAHANEVLPKLLGCGLLSGCDAGTMELKMSRNCLKAGKFLKDHPIMTGVQYLYEGVTISYPPVNQYGKLKVLATSTHGNPVILIAENLDNLCGNVIVDCGYTKLFVNFNTAGTGRYISNATCWLTGLL